MKTISLTAYEVKSRDVLLDPKFPTNAHRFKIVEYTVSAGTTVFLNFTDGTSWAGNKDRLLERIAD